MDIKLFTIVTKSYTEIFNDMFLPRIPSSFDKITVDYFINNDATPGRVATKEFKQLSFKKVKLIHHYIKSNFGNAIVFCDTDTVFLSDFKDDLLSRINDYDILFQDNGDGTYNSGFILFICSDKVLRFWEMIMANYNESVPKYANDQFAINGLIHSYDIKHGYLPKSYYANTVPLHDPNDPNVDSHLNEIVQAIPSDAVLVHCVAINGGTRGKKMIMTKIINNYK